MKNTVRLLAALLLARLAVPIAAQTNPAMSNRKGARAGKWCA